MPAGRDGVAEGAELRDEELYDFLEGGALERAEPYERELYIGSVEANEPTMGTTELDDRLGGGSLGEGGETGELPPGHPRQHAPTSGELKVARALEVFNAGEQPRRVAGVARSLGAPTVTARPLEESGSTVAIVVAWELCWYRYEVDLGDEAAGPRLVAEGMELDELPAEDRLANAAADERGELAALSL
jgi:hypothetical protein